MTQKCRFCLKNFNRNEVYFGITEEIKQNFESLAQTNFILSTTKKNLICELCMRSLQVANLLKHQFITSQIQFLAVDDEIKGENLMHIADKASTSSKNLENTVNTNVTQEEIFGRSISAINKEPVAKIEVIKQDPVVQQNRVIKSDPGIKIIRRDPVQKGSETVKRYPVISRIFVQNTATKNELTKPNTVSHTPTNIVDKILLKFEAIDKSSTVKSTILGTNNIKTIKKSNRRKTLTAKALELIKQEEVGYNCPFCTDSFLTKSHLGIHIASNHQSDILECDVCRKKFIHQEELNNHVISSHPKERIHTCSMCPKAYTLKSTLKKHIVAKHPNSKYRCNYNLCHLTFDKFDAIRSHMVEAHPEVKFRDMFSSIDKIEPQIII